MAKKVSELTKHLDDFLRKKQEELRKRGKCEDYISRMSAAYNKYRSDRVGGTDGH